MGCSVFGCSVFAVRTRVQIWWARSRPTADRCANANAGATVWICVRPCLICATCASRQCSRTTPPTATARSSCA
eukprot:2995331-Prymnesium_polylepis.2